VTYKTISIRLKLIRLEAISSK